MEMRILDGRPFPAELLPKLSAKLGRFVLGAVPSGFRRPEARARASETSKKQWEARRR